jgi:membrane protease YdiL (CAAX protease family)
MDTPPSSPQALSFGRIFFLVLALVLLELSLHGLLMPLMGLYPAALLGTAGALVAVPWGLARRLELPRAELFRLRPLPPATILWTVVATAAAVPAVDRLTALNLRLLPRPTWYEEALAEARPESVVGWLLAVAAVVAVGPLGEEMVFRGLLQRAGRPAVGRRQALWLTAVLFAAVHLQPYHLLGLLGVGALLGFLFERSGSLLAPLLAHALYNGVSLVSLGQDPDTASPLDGPTAWPLAAGGALLALWAVRRIRPDDPTWWTNRWSDPD